MGIRNTADVPSKKLYDGVDYLPLPRWKVFLIQLLNIAGLGPVFGAILGAAYGPVAFVWITLGGIFFGAMHDFLSGVVSLRNGGQSLQKGCMILFVGTKQVMRIFSMLSLISLAGFMSQARRIDWPTSSTRLHLTPPHLLQGQATRSVGCCSSFWA